MVHWVLPRFAWVSVPVATVWNQPDRARPEDAGAVSAHPDVADWLASLSYRQKVGLDDLLATQVLLDQPVVTVGDWGAWAHVLVRGQTGSVYPFGIAGWVPTGQLTFRAPPVTARRGTVAVPRLHLPGLTLSYGTVLPVLSPSASPAPPASELTVELPNGRFNVPASALRTAPLAPSGPAVVAEAKRFVGLQYLWAGTSAFGFDCSGLTYSVYRQFGITLARDAADQARGGRPVAATELRPGDLVFFAFDGSIDHVGIYAGDGLMVDAPHTGAAVEVVPLWSHTLAPYFAGARRYL
jgi:hypothetical protein